jgi:hypothetical protein
MPSEIIGTGGLWVGLAAAILIVIAQRPSASQLAPVVKPALAVLALQCLHFIEEFTTEFYVRFPERLGLAPWSAEFFVVFNVTWIVLWLLGIWAARAGRAPTYAAIVLWFLGIAAIANGIAHPILALLARGYFPGLITSPFLGIAGVFLVRLLTRRDIAT